MQGSFPETITTSIFIYKKNHRLEYFALKQLICYWHPSQIANATFKHIFYLNNHKYLSENYKCMRLLNPESLDRRSQGE